jgi:hypothetical protein
VNDGFNWRLVVEPLARRRLSNNSSIEAPVYRVFRRADEAKLFRVCLSLRVYEQRRIRINSVTKMSKGYYVDFFGSQNLTPLHPMERGVNQNRASKAGRDKAVRLVPTIVQSVEKSAVRPEALCLSLTGWYKCPTELLQRPKVVHYTYAAYNLRLRNLVEIHRGCAP